MYTGVHFFFTHPRNVCTIFLFIHLDMHNKILHVLVYLKFCYHWYTSIYYTNISLNNIFMRRNTCTTFSYHSGFSHFQLDSYSIPSLHCFSCQLMSIDHFQIINIKKLCTIYQLFIYSAIGTPLTTFCFNATLCVFVLECAVLQNLENSQTLSIMPLRFLFNIFYR